MPRGDEPVHWWAGARVAAITNVSGTGRCPGPDVKVLSGSGQYTSWVNRAVRGNVFDIAMRNADILEVEAIQAIQCGSHLLAFASFLKRIPASPDEASDLPVGRLHYWYRAHGGPPGALFLPAGCQDMRGSRLTFGLHFPYRRLILCVATGARASTIGGHPREWQLALSVRGVRIRH
jgi:hypothetical protein